jgi:hypothetical protein
MKLPILSAVMAAGLLAALTGCETGPSIPYDPSLGPSASSSDKIAVTSITSTPARPVAHEDWKVTMTVRNLSHQPLKDVRYEFVYAGGGGRLGAGTIPQIEPGQSVRVMSDSGKNFEQGSYRVEGRVFSEGLEPLYRDRMNNWKDVNVVVAQ